MQRYEVIPHAVWEHVTGKRASVFGALPWLTSLEGRKWQVVTEGYTIRDNDRATVGGFAGLDRLRKIGQADFEHVTELAAMLNARVAA